MLSRLPQPFTDRTDAAFSVQGKGWRTVSEQLHGIRFTDRRCARADYLDALTEGGDAGGVLLTLDDYYLPGWNTPEPAMACCRTWSLSMVTGRDPTSFGWSKATPGGPERTR